MDQLTSALDFAAVVTIAAILICLMLSAFFSGSETALTASSKAKLRARADRGDSGAEAAVRVTADSEKLIGAILLGNNVVNILAASLATALFTRLLGAGGVAIATLVMTVLVLIFSEVMPKTYAISAPEKVASLVARPIGILTVILSPIVSVVRLIVGGMLSVAGLKTDPGKHMFSLEEEIEGALSLGHAQGAVNKEDRDRLLGALDLGNRTVEEIMRHRSEIQMIDGDLPPEKILELVLASPHTRLPVYREERENIVGVIHAKDLLRAVNRAVGDAGDASAARRFDLAAVMMPPISSPRPASWTSRCASS